MAWEVRFTATMLGSPETIERQLDGVMEYLAERDPNAAVGAALATGVVEFDLSDERDVDLGVAFDAALARLRDAFVAVGADFVFRSAETRQQISEVAV